MATLNKKAPVRKSNTRYATSAKTTKARSKSRTGSSSLVRSSKSTLFTKRNGLIAAGMAAIAGLAFVALSFAGGTPDYQYSLTTKCAGEKATQSCKDNSAEAMAYRLFTGIKGVEPDQAAYAFWTQQLAGERITFRRAALLMIDGTPTAKNASNQAFLTTLYQGMLRRDPEPKGLASWSQRLASKKWTRTKVATTFATGNEAKTMSAAAFNTYAAKADPVTVTQTAKAAQAKRLASMKKYASSAKKNAEAAKKYEANANAALRVAKATSSLAAIAENKNTATSWAAKARTAARANAAQALKAKRLQQNAKELADYATDIGSDATVGIAKINNVYKLVDTYSKGASKSASAATKTLKQFDVAYNALAAKLAAPPAQVDSGIGNTTTGPAIVIDTTKSIGEQIEECNAKPLGLGPIVRLQHGTRKDLIEPAWRNGACRWIVVGRDYKCDRNYYGSGMACVPNSTIDKEEISGAISAAVAKNYPKWGSINSFGCAYDSVLKRTGEKKTAQIGDGGTKARCRMKIGAGYFWNPPDAFLCNSPRVYKAVNLNDYYKGCRNRYK